MYVVRPTVNIAATFHSNFDLLEEEHATRRLACLIALFGRVPVYLDQHCKWLLNLIDSLIISHYQYN